MAEPSWQELLRLRLVERNAKENAFAPIIEQCMLIFYSRSPISDTEYKDRRLAQQTKLLKERNASLLRAVGSVRGNPSASTVLVPSPGEEWEPYSIIYFYLITYSRSRSNPVRAAYMASLESQISSLRDELATVYKTQGQNAQRLLSMNETLREKEELSRIDSENLRKTRDDLAVFRRKVEQHNELMAEKDRTAQVCLTYSIHISTWIHVLATAQVLHDEISTLQLELGQIEERNQTLTKDNAKLLQRWLDAKQTEANKMNEANQFYENMRSQHQAVLNWRDDTGKDVADNAGLLDAASQNSASGNEDRSEDNASMQEVDGTPPLPPKHTDLTPNGWWSRNRLAEYLLSTLNIPLLCLISCNLFTTINGWSSTLYRVHITVSYWLFHTMIFGLASLEKIANTDLNMHISAEAKVEQWDKKNESWQWGKILEIEKRNNNDGCVHLRIEGGIISEKRWKNNGSGRCNQASLD
jgi:autophagy-related protein 16-1